MMNYHFPREKSTRKESKTERRMISWIAPPLEKELDELPGHAPRLGISVEELITAYKKGSLQILSDEDWNRLKNCDSQNQSWQVHEIESYRGHARDVSGLKERMESGQETWAPVVLFRRGHDPFLIGGNTRLMLCRALNIQPMVWAIHL